MKAPGTGGAGGAGPGPVRTGARGLSALPRARYGDGGARGRSRVPRGRVPGCAPRAPVAPGPAAAVRRHAVHPQGWRPLRGEDL